MNGKPVRLILGLSIAAACGVILVGSMSGSTVTSVAFADLPKRTSGQTLEIYGKLNQNTIRPIRGANLVEFELIEEKTHKRMTVLYDNPRVSLPANFPAASHAKVTGVFNAMDSRFDALSVTTKCPSKYSQEQDLARDSRVKEWLKATGLKEESASAGSRPTTL